MDKPKLKLARKKEVVEDNSMFFASPKTHLELVSTGCELLNCTVGGGWPLGRVVNIVGDKSTGKTLMAIEAMANFRLQYPEGKTEYCETEAAFDDEYAAALGLDMTEVGRSECETVEDLFDKMTKFIDDVGPEGRGLYIVDSLDALSDKAEQGRGIADSTYGASKPKQLGQLFRRLIKPLEKSNVLVIIISQVRDAIGVSFGEKHTRSGGRALDFYASQIVWLANLGQIKKTINKTQRTIGVTIKAKVKKCKIGLPFRECSFDIIFGYGIDDVGANLDYLKTQGELGQLNIGSTDQSIAAYKKGFANASDEEQAEMRAQMAKAVKSTWYRVEKTFLPPRGKYVLKDHA
jgi:recombination protein RecA